MENDNYNKLKKEYKEISYSVFKKGDFIIKLMTKNEFEITKIMIKKDHFPKILNESEFDINHLKVKKKYYTFKNIEYNFYNSVVKNYIKSLLLCIKELNNNGYIHGHIKQKNFLFELIIII